MTESMTERTVQKITKVIRGTSRSESRSKKNRESSLSPKGGPHSSGKDVDLKEDLKAAKKLEKSETGEKSKKGAAKETGGGEKKDLDKKRVPIPQEFKLIPSDIIYLLNYVSFRLFISLFSPTMNLRPVQRLHTSIIFPSL